ncbi:MAG: hypothetical protein MUE60_07070 [Candidatus Eisenbacteria bacterium]|jgi:hypothetical protein|nr:hypothetical protein [Candidatus Eisenbacteria bacterium]
MRAARMLVRVTLVAVFVCRLMASPAAVRVDTTTTNHVGVRLIKELTFDSEIQILRLKDGLPRLVVTEKTINWLGRDGNVETQIVNPSIGQNEVVPSDPVTGMTRGTRVFASRNGEWVGVAEYEIHRGVSVRATLRTLSSSGLEVSRYSIEPLASVVVGDNGFLVGVYGSPAFYPEPCGGGDAVLYGAGGRELIRVAGGVHVAVDRGCGAALVAIPRENAVTLHCFDREGSELWATELDGETTWPKWREPCAFSSDGERIIVVTQSASPEYGVTEREGLSFHLHLLSSSGKVIASHSEPGDVLWAFEATPNLVQGAAGGMRDIIMVDLPRGAEIGRWAPGDDSSPPFLWSESGRFLLCPTRDWRIPLARKVPDQTVVLERMHLDLKVPDQVVLLDRQGRAVWHTLLPNGATVASLERLPDGDMADDVFVAPDRDRLLVLGVIGGER